MKFTNRFIVIDISVSAHHKIGNYSYIMFFKNKDIITVQSGCILNLQENTWSVIGICKFVPCHISNLRCRNVNRLVEQRAKSSCCRSHAYIGNLSDSILLFIGQGFICCIGCCIGTVVKIGTCKQCIDFVL